MKLPQIHTPDNYIHRADPLKRPDRLLPFHPVRWGYSSDHTLNFDVDPGAFVVFYVLEGIACFHNQEESSYVSKDRLIISSCNTKLTISCASPQWKFFYAAISGTHAGVYCDAVSSHGGVIPAGAAASSLSIYFTDLCNMPRPEDMYGDMQACYLVHQILHGLLEAVRESGGEAVPPPGSAHAADQARKYIEEHYREELTVDHICQQVNFSKFYLCRLFKERTGQTLHQYLTSCRVNKSKEYLTCSGLTIHAIAQEVGFKNTLTYSRAFKQYINMTPSEYREAVLR